MVFIWDYDKKELEKTETGRILILERMINYGPDPNERIKLSEVKKYWDRLDLYEAPKHLLELLIWKKCRTSHQPKSLFSIK
ncbi:hypothetical protein A2767_02005 [Candidatus Roizmanbacteria bacterium RIFCSPHIGHO2_01_FULL_35_10]|uniref:Uncharacterized protein n=1 Tax=Candidatus Roizmanbacteria bacterium RIFCSPLOWO2_01_FULL_35_13 TaxID=1802055 RepID=A0A1F7I793_9BACT|nr:MAG: hypothetical protein A2767_02005 [Candidatus Roizmanbacteria bacterium RIFCSPHIGHO2_01_FULL_35_10]OGK39234.1 MAG: hypothetical protein A3A74_07420 [Candidatus Roizmanbacteria bacterium RIFCSPLOWO2_01_FULL_35_13]